MPSLQLPGLLLEVCYGVGGVVRSSRFGCFLCRVASVLRGIGFADGLSRPQRYYRDMRTILRPAAWRGGSWVAFKAELAGEVAALEGALAGCGLNHFGSTLE